MSNRHFSDDDRPIQVEISTGAEARSVYELEEGNPRGIGGHVEDKIKELSEDALFEAFRTIYKVARKTELLIGDLHTDETPEGVTGAEVAFGIKFSSGAEAVITSSLEATIRVTLRWDKYDPDRRE